VRRRSFLTAATGTALASIGATSSRPKIGTSDLSRLQARFDELVHADNTGDAGSLESEALQFARTALALQQNHSASQRVRSGLYLLAASFTSTAMWAAVDAHQVDDAQRHRESAVTLAGLSGDSGIQFRIWSHTAILALQCENWPEAVAAAAVARNSSVTRKDPLFASLAHARNAGVLAMVGDRTSAFGSLRAAEKAWERVDPLEFRPTWMDFYDQAELEGLSAIVHLHLGQYAEAEAFTHRALTRLRPELRRNRTYYTAQLAVAQLLQGEVEQACGTAMQAAGDCAGRSSRILTRFDKTLARVAPDSRDASNWREYRRISRKGTVA
jgi:tetratricopeptide (TPR) repeat protein